VAYGDHLELHIVFNYSAAVDVRKAVAGRDATVVRFSDDLSYGPINPLEPAVRRAWMLDHVGFDSSDITDDEDVFWPKVLAKDTSRIAWVSRRCAGEYCGFLEYLRRLDDLPTRIIDTTDAKCDDREFFPGTGAIPASRILSDGLLDTACEIDADSRAGYKALWRKLRADNGDLRVVEKNLALSSVPWSFFDKEILALATYDWQPVTRIVSNILSHRSVNDLLLLNRVYELVDAGVLAEREAGRFPDVKLASP
jgi:hypothetical protein